MTNKNNNQLLLNARSDAEASECFAPAVTWDEALQHMQHTYQPTGAFRHNIIVLQDPDILYPEHTHDFFEMVYILSGNEIHLINQSAKYFCAGDLYMLPPAAKHTLPENDAGSCICILIHPDAFESVFSSILHGQDCLGSFLMNSLYRNDSETYLTFHTGQNREFKNIMIKMLDLMANVDDYTDRVLTGMLVLLFTSLSRSYKDVLGTAPENDRNSKILTLIYEQYNTITLAALAEELHYTVPYCSKYLKNQLGCTFSELIGKIRFQKAESFLLHSDMTVSQISHTVGYENPENFMRAFKHRYRMTPSQYRIARRPPCPPPGLKIEKLIEKARLFRNGGYHEISLWLLAVKRGHRLFFACADLPCHYQGKRSDAVCADASH
ncbi:MAG: AraC family transcriptional regulator [Bacillus sp. (in: Bacteria)]|nr:AraC family transcriptional regulator [Bacillus sp. (in: firmicutes)]MCM1425749.1 AraC family transcriptional regulator [Eubacterium sp.]